VLARADSPVKPVKPSGSLDRDVAAVRALLADAMIALQKWPGKLEVIGPISPRQDMAVAFRKGAPRLRAAFDEFLAEARRDGTYDRLVGKYFPEAPIYFPDAFGRAGAAGGR